jgi:hypothetical protein
MWFYILLIVFLGLFLWWLSRTNLFRRWRRHGSDPAGHNYRASGVEGRPYDGT